MPGAMTASMRSAQEKRKVMHSAKHPIESSLGRTLLKTNFSDESALSAELYKLEKMKKRHRMHSLQEKKSFLQNRNLPEPTLIVERPPSPDTLRKCYPNTGDTLPEYSYRPRYMQQLNSRARTPSNFVTIDAFAVKTKKKMNYWDVNQDAAASLRFQSAFVPSFRLTNSEKTELQRACSMHPGFQRPLSATGEKLIASGDPHSRMIASRQRARSRARLQRLPVVNPEEFEKDPDTVFITELHSNHHQENADRAIRTVTFANKLKVDDNTMLLKGKADNNAHKIAKDCDADGFKTENKERADSGKIVARKVHKKTKNKTKGNKNVEKEQKEVEQDNMDNKLEDFHQELDAVKLEDEEVSIAENNSEIVKPPDDEEPDMKEEIRKWLQKTYQFF